MRILISCVGMVLGKTVENHDIPFIFNARGSLGGNQDCTSVHFLEPTRSSNSQQNQSLTVNLRPESSVQVRVEPSKKWGMDWGTIP